MKTNLLAAAGIVSLLTFTLFCLPAIHAQPETAPPAAANLALVAKPSTSFVSGNESLDAINDGFTPRRSSDHSHGAYGNWPRTGTQWVQYDWPVAISTNKIDVYWFDDNQGDRVPAACRLQYWNGADFVAVPGAQGLGTLPNQFNTTTFPEISTSKLRLEIDGNGQSSDGILEFRVYDSGKSPDLPPVIVAGPDRDVMLNGQTFLAASVKNIKPTAAKLFWSMAAGPGDVTFADRTSAITTARFSATGDYTLKLTAQVGDLTSSDFVHVSVDTPPPADRLEPIYTKAYTINSPLWDARAKALLVNWIPHCMDECSNLNLREGGINNLIQAANKLAGKPYTAHVGYPFSNAWVLNTVEAMSVALQVDAKGDPDIIKAQTAMKSKLEEWIPIILAAQEPDGYFQTRFTLDRRGPAVHWTIKTEHEGYVAGYFLEMAIANYLATDGKDLRLYNAAKKLADCWDANIGPAPKKTWYDGHEEMEQALVRFGRFVDDVEPGNKGKKYITLAKFLLDCRKNGDEYDQTHLPVIQQYEAVGHAVRDTYLISGMADVATETGDTDYQSAVKSLWSNIVNKKYYITGGVGSGETSEGYGKNYSLPNNAYCESCSGCGELFLQFKMNLAYHDAKYADLMEETLYNAILGDYDLAGNNFCYTNALDQSGAITGRGPGQAVRYTWHNCPCCVANIPRTLLMLPTWMYAKGADSLYVNMFIGSTVNVENFAGTTVQMIQTTDYPWKGAVAMTVNPAAEKTFSIKIRVPDRSVSDLYTSTPAANGLNALTVNGVAVENPKIDNGYATITRTWKASDKITFDLPLVVQRVKASDKVAADVGKVALRVGPLLYNIESADQDVNQILAATSPLTTEFQPNFLGGVLAVKGTFANGSPLIAVPNFARNNRPGRSLVWIRDQ